MKNHADRIAELEATVARLAATVDRYVDFFYERDGIAACDRCGTLFQYGKDPVGILKRDYGTRGAYLGGGHYCIQHAIEEYRGLRGEHPAWGEEDEKVFIADLARWLMSHRGVLEHFQVVIGPDFLMQDRQLLSVCNTLAR